MKRDVFKGFLEQHWKKIILIVILLVSSYKAYANYVSADQRLKETEEAVIMKWFGPKVHYSMVREWNENGVRGWSKETAVLGELTFQSDNSIKTDSIKIMWEYVNEEMQ